jgi:CHAT domain-containing protein
LEFQYYDTLAELKLRAGDPPAAREFLKKAIAIAELGAHSLTTWQERLAWMDQHRQPFALMTESLLESGQDERALETWEDYRLAATSAAKVIKVNNSLTGPSLNRPVTVSLNRMESAGFPDHGDHPIVITYAFAPDALMIWVRRLEELHSAYVPISYRELQRTAESFISECSRPDSALADLHADGQSLYALLLQPVRRWLPESGHLVIEPDGVLGVMPFEALVAPSREYLGTQYTITMAPTVRGDPSGRTGAVAVSDRALIVAAPAADAGVLEPPPGALAEARAVAGDFEHPELLLGREANVARVEHALESSSIFHFAGHASLGRSGVAMLMANGPLDSEHARVFDAHKLHNLKLAIFSACATARPSEISASNSLVSEFLQAGTQNVVASRWNVDSMATTDFVKLFYSSVLSGHSVAQSLQSAASAIRNTTNRSHPYYWAAFSAFGRA